VLDASRFETDGYRATAPPRRDQAYAKLTLRRRRHRKLTVTASGLRQDDTQDPLGVTWATYQRDPRAGEIDTTDTQTPQAHAGRPLQHPQEHRPPAGRRHLGQRFGDDRLHLTAVWRQPPA
jgi:iron complex outermembrane receptor protein